jgi:nicotinamide mononucleotide transporter
VDPATLMPPIEWIAVGLGLINITLLIRRSIWNYPFGIAMVALYFFIFQEQRLYSGMLLQLFFAGVQAIGWFSWWRLGGLDQPVAVRSLSLPERLVWPIGALLGLAWWSWVVTSLTDAAVPLWDAAIAVGSVVAQLLLIRRMIENWLVWIVVNILAVGLYWRQDLQLTAGLYVVFLGMCVIGWFEWRRVQRAQPANG